MLALEQEGAAPVDVLKQCELSSMNIKTSIVAAIVVAVCSSSVAWATEPAKAPSEPAPLRIGLVYAPSKSIYFVTKRDDGQADGVTADLATAYGTFSGKNIKQVLYANSGQAADALEKAEIDISFMPVDASRRARFDFGPAYVAAESTYMVTKQSGVTSLTDIDREDLRILAVANTSTLRSAEASLKKGKITSVASVKEAVLALRDGKADAFALSRDSLPVYLPEVPGSFIVDGAFQRVPIAIAVRKGDAEKLAEATDFLNSAKSDGTVRKALDAAGYPEQPVSE